MTELTLKKGREIIYLVLRKKPFSTEIFGNIEKDVEKRLSDFIISIGSQLEKMKFKDPEQCLKILILKSIINILRNMIKEDIIKLSEYDLNILNQLLSEEEKNLTVIDGNIKNNENSSKEKTKKKEKEDDNNHWWYIFSTNFFH